MRYQGLYQIVVVCHSSWYNLFSLQFSSEVQFHHQSYRRCEVLQLVFFNIRKCLTFGTMQLPICFLASAPTVPHNMTSRKLLNIIRPKTHFTFGGTRSIARHKNIRFLAYYHLTWREVLGGH
uniref:Uncharacterized protein n=1 Tax=Opuntia streptacantha TaxID=393608 RepID=A0A7C9AFW0_OPUST